LTALFAICLAFPLVRPRAWSQVILVMLAAANYALVFLSGSRGTLLTATGCALVLLVLARQMRGRWLVALTVPLVALAITAQFGSRETRAVERINLLLNPRANLADRTSGRSQLVATGWRMFVEHPLGVGTGGYAVTRATFADVQALWTTPAQKEAHAGWIKILAENGLPGLVLMVAYVLSFPVAGWRWRSRDSFMLGVLVTLSFGLGFVSTEYQSKGLWFLAAGVMVLFARDTVLMPRRSVAA
jgi:O-antigen ligase